MESVDGKGKRKNKRGVEGDDDGGKKGNGDCEVLSLERDCRIGDNVEGKKKRKKRKEKKECVVSGDVGGDEEVGEIGVHGKLEKKKKKEKMSGKERKRENDLGKVRRGKDGSDENVGEMENGGDVVRNSERGEVFGVHGESKKKKKEKKSGKERRREKDLGKGTISDIDCADENVGEMENGGDVVRNSERGEVFGVDGESKKKKKKEKKSGKERRREKDLGKGRISDIDCADDDIEKKPRKKKRKREKERVVDDSTCDVGENLDKEVLEDVGRKKRKTGNGKNNKSANDLVSREVSSTVKMERNDGEINSKNKGEGEGEGEQIKQSENTKAKKGRKKVSFSGQVEVFPLPSDSSNQEKVQAKRFTAEEDKIIREAVHNYIEEHGLGEEGLNMVLHCKSQPEVKGCWKEIAEAIPYRPSKAVYNRAHILFERGERRKWSAEEIEILKKYLAEHGNKWKDIAEELGRHRRDVKDAWRRLKVLDKNKGSWLQTELQSLFDLVNSDLRLKIIEDEEKKKKHGMLRDNIHWTAISEALKTRTGPNCSMKWYSQLQSPMVAENIWADIDDNRLIDELYTLDASCIEDVDWDNLLDNRSGDICRKRWNQMVLHIGKNKSFSEQVEILTKRYCPDLIEVREAWEKKPVVD